MSSIANIKNFTTALTLFCVAIFIFFILPESLSTFNNALKYILIIYSIVILMMYSKILNELENDSSEKSNLKDVNQIAFEIKNKTAKELYDKLISLTIQTCKSINPNYKSAIYIIEPEKQAYILQSGKGNEFSDSIAVNNLLVKKYLSTNKKVHQKDHSSEWSEMFFGQTWRGSECAIFSPIHIEKSIIGFVLTYMQHFNDLSEQNINLLNKLGQFVSSGLENLDNLEKHIIGEDTKSLILEILSNLDFKSDANNIFSQFKYLLRTFFQYDRATISLRKESENRRKYDKGVNSIIKLTDGVRDKFIEGSDFPTNGSLHGLPVITGTPIQTNDWKKTYHNLVRFKSTESEDYSFKSVMASPIVIEGESKGSIVLERHDIKLFSNEELKDLILIGQVLGSALHWRYEYKKIHLNATHDGLSGLLNHQTFKERFNDEIQRAARFQQKMAVMIFDLDKFKRVNDSLGHQYGDYVIQTVAKIMQNNVRAVDVVARYGGEEFAIILINTTAVMSNIVAQRIVDNIAEFQFSLDGVDTRLTISGGMSEYPSHSKDVKELIEIADKEMYSTKQNGGNGITIYQKEGVDETKS